MLVLDALPKMVRSDTDIAQYIENAFGGVDNCRKTILADFCRHAVRGTSKALGVAERACREEARGHAAL